ncbi:hypothetical protein [Burkholderia gladioli]|uniref:hypothetical protein n=1 Tax=Burkholderia gladioli TaxID=28095 RepID=UPI0019174272|nr:hypothetical protein [Burkholderia gladioli]
MTLIERIASRFGYVKLNREAFASASDGATSLAALPLDRRTLQPADFGLRHNVTFHVLRGAHAGSRPITFAEALDFLDACGIDVNAVQGEAAATAIFAGAPFRVDGADMSFREIR